LKIHWKVSSFVMHTAKFANGHHFNMVSMRCMLTHNNLVLNPVCYYIHTKQFLLDFHHFPAAYPDSGTQSYICKPPFSWTCSIFQRKAESLLNFRN